MSEDRSYEITPEALRTLEAELAELEGPARRAMAQRIKTAREWGDLKENAEYHDAKNDQAHLETKIMRLQDRVRHAVVVEGGAVDGTARMGAKVGTRDEDSGRETTYELVPATEADPGSGKLSIEAPLAQSLLGAKVDDVVEFVAPRGTKRLRVTSVS